MKGIRPADAAHEAAGFTGRFTAGLRYLESMCVPNPVLLSDPLAEVLAGDRGLELAKKELRQLIDAQGPGKHLRVPARSRLIDDMITQEVSELRQKQEQEEPLTYQAKDSTQGPTAMPPGDAEGAVGSTGPGATTLHGSPESDPGFVSGNGSGSEASGPHGSCGRNTGVVCQVVSLGAGMCTRPWRLACLAVARVFEVDLPHIAQAKATLLAEAGAQCTAGTSAPSTANYSLENGRQQLKQQQQQQQRNGGCNSPTSAAATSRSHLAPTAAGSCLLPESRQHGQQQSTNDAEQHQQHQQQLVFPLLAASYACIGADLSTSSPNSLSTVLISHGFTASIPTIWVLEALLYYMPLVAASELLCQLAALSAPGSRLIATCVDNELLEASLRGVSKDHVFADLWHFEAEALLYDTPAFRECWQVDWFGQPDQTEQPEQPEHREVAGAAGPGAEGPATCLPSRRLPASTRRLAKDRLGADTYVALYGGSELLFAAGLRKQHHQ